jgi:diguanylate cyclase
MNIIRDLFININILVALIFAYSQIISRNQDLTMPSNVRLIIGGVANGGLGVILMLFSIQVTSETIVDLRHVPVMLSMIYGGPLSAIISASVIVLARFAIGFNTSSIASFVLMVVITLGYLIITKLSLKKITKINIMLIHANIIFSLVIIYLVPDWSVLKILLPLYWILSYIGGFAAFYFSEYLRETNKLFQEYKVQSTCDFLTGLWNVREFNKTLESIVKHGYENKEEHSLLYIDIDHFKKVNDTYGHNEGDEVLKQLSRIMLSNTRPTDSCFRKGGEEFSIILPNCKIGKAQEIAERIRNAVELHPFKLTSGAIISVTISIGISHFPSTAKDETDLVENADEALYLSKKLGRNRISIAARKKANKT